MSEFLLGNSAALLSPFQDLFLPAYIGPGTGLSAIGAFLAIVAFIFVALVGFIWYPIKRLLRKKKPAPAHDGQTGAGE